MSAVQVQNQIIEALILSAAVELKYDRTSRHHENGPAFALCQIACMTCQKQMKPNYIKITFVEGEEEKWQPQAQSRLDQHLTQFHADLKDLFPSS